MAQRIPITKIRATLIPTTRRTDRTTRGSTICFGIQIPYPICFGTHTTGRRGSLSNTTARPPDCDIGGVERRRAVPAQVSSTQAPHLSTIKSWK
jgi:hypothetical protein